MATSLKQYRDSDLIAEYWRENGGRCEIGNMLPEIDREKVEYLRPNKRYKKLELHHIWHSSKHKIESRSNIIIIDSIIHRNWGHDMNTLKLTIVCLYAKWFKEDPAEFDLDELREAAGQCVLGWLDWKRNEFDTNSDYWKMSTEMIEFV